AQHYARRAGTRVRISSSSAATTQFDDGSHARPRTPYLEKESSMHAPAANPLTAPEELSSSEARLWALVQYSSDVITVLAPDGTVQYNTPAVRHVLGYEPSELLGRSAFDFVHPDDVEHVGERFGVALAQPGAAVPVTFRFRHRDGHWVPLEAIGSNRLDDPNVNGIVVNSRD